MNIDADCQGLRGRWPSSDRPPRGRGGGGAPSGAGLDAAPRRVAAPRRGRAGGCPRPRRRRARWRKRDVAAARGG